MFHHDLPFDPTYGCDLQALLKIQVPPPAPDFANFWRQSYAEALAVPLDIQCREIESPSSALRVWEVEFNSLDQLRIGGWLVRPRNQVVTQGLVMGHGYGGRATIDPDVLLADAAVLFPCARGFHRSARADLPSTSAFHVRHGIESRQTYIHRGCCADIVWCAVSALQALEPAVGKRIGYHGGSFGGGIGAMACPWDQRIRRVSLEVPSFGNHPLRVTLPCTGSGEAIRLLHQRQPGIMEVLRYFDAATCARFLTVPTQVCCALFDPAVPPPGQFAVANAVAGPYQLLVRQAGHFSYPWQDLEDQRLGAVRRSFLNQTT